MKVSPIKSLALASAAALPMTGTAEAQNIPPNTAGQNAYAAPPPVWMPRVYISAEGGRLWSDYSRTSFPGGLDPAFLGETIQPFGSGGPTFPLNKLGNSGVNPDDFNSLLSPGRNHGWFGALSVSRDIDPIWDWRLAGTFTSFGTNSRSGKVTQSGAVEDIFGIPGFNGFQTTSRTVTESDRFSFATFDLDMGRKFQFGLLQTRAFAGLRAMSAEQRLNITDSEAKGLFGSDIENGLFPLAGRDRLTETTAKSRFAGVGPRVGVEGFYGQVWGITGSASAAFIAGWRESTFAQMRSGNSFLCLPECIGGSINPDVVNVHRSKFTGVGDLTGTLGVAYRPTPNHWFEFGYKTEYLINVQDSFNFANGSAISGQFDQKKNIFMQGLYVKATLVY